MTTTNQQLEGMITNDQLTLSTTIDQDQGAIMSDTTYDVIEDNGGGLHLYVSIGDEVVYTHSGYEYARGHLLQDIAAIKAGYDPLSFDGNEIGTDSYSPRDSWSDEQARNGAWHLVADQNGTYPEVMGRAAQLEFGIAHAE